MVTRPRALAYLTSSSRQIASAQHFASEALWPRAQGYGGLQSAVKAQLPLRNGSLTQDKQRGRRFGKECLRESRSTHLQKLLSQKWGGGRQKAWHHPQVRSSLPCLRTGPAAGRRPWRGPWGSEVVDRGRSRAPVSWPRAGGCLPGQCCGQVRVLLALGGGPSRASAFTS